MERLWKWLSLTCANDSRDERGTAERDNCRLRSNWVFVVFAFVGKTINTICVIPTNHQFIINPTAESLNITDQKIEPGLEQSETFYSLTYVVMFMSHAIAALAVGILFNFVPTWYLFLASTLSHTFGYLLYALATSGWMMMLARSLAGLSQGAVVALAFAYFAVSYDKYTENLKIIGKFEEKKAVKLKGYLYSTNSIGNVLGVAIGVGFPTILAQFSNTPQFRPAGWFCVAAGVILLLLQLVLFHGECAWHINRTTCAKYSEKLPSFKRGKDQRCTDLFWQIVLPLFVIVVGGLKGMRYAIHEVLLNPITADTFGFSDRDISYIYLIFLFSRPIGSLLLYGFQYFKLKGYFLTVIGLLCTIVSLLIMTDWQAMGNDPCMDYSIFHNQHLADEYRVQLTMSNISQVGLVSVQSLKVVEDDVYQMAVNKCESAGDHCHWIPNSQVTHKHCSDCQPICRDTRHTLNFVQFIIGVVFLISTLPLMYTGVFLLLSETVSKQFQGLSAGTMVALVGASRSVFPLLLDALYEHEQKRTFLAMLVQVGIYLPLLVGLLLLYPCFTRLKKSYNSNQTTEEDNELLIPSSSQKPK